MLGLALLMLLQGSSKRRPWHDSAAALIAAALLGALASAGHGASTPGAIGDVQLTGDVLHLIASGVWVGGLLPFAVTLAHARRQGPAGFALAYHATARFSLLALVGVVVLLCTGIVNTYVLAGSVPALLGTPYGRLLIVKISLFVAMVCVAAINRRRLTPALMNAGAIIGAAPQVMRPLGRNSLIEWTLGLGVIVAVAVLGTMTPAMHNEPVWPLRSAWSSTQRRKLCSFCLYLAFVLAVAFARYSGDVAMARGGRRGRRHSALRAGAFYSPHSRPIRRHTGRRRPATRAPRS